MMALSKCSLSPFRPCFKIARHLKVRSQSPGKVFYRNISEVSKPVLTLFTKENCSLCDLAMEGLKPYLSLVQFEEVDIEDPDNMEWFEKYKYDIPVFHLNGVFLMKHRVNLNLFKDRLKDFSIEIND